MQECRTNTKGEHRDDPAIFAFLDYKVK